MSRRQGAALILVVALALLGGSVAWAVGSARDGSFNGHHYAYGPAMMGLGYETGKASPVNGNAEARQRAQAFADRLGLKTDEVLRFERNYYVKLVDKQGANATEVLVDPQTGATSLEYGPAMMWNTKYGMLSGRLGSRMMGASAMRSMMGSYGGSYSDMMGGKATGGGMMGGAYGTAAPPSTSGARTGLLTPAKAEAAARAWLLANEPGTGVKDAEAFPGYYTLETTRGGTIAGMISVNATTGAVWPHWWHGRFVG